MELGFEAEMGAEIEVGVGGEALEVLLAVVWFCDGVSDADLEVTGAGGGWVGLCAQEGGAAEQHGEGQPADGEGSARVGAN